MKIEIFRKFRLYWLPILSVLIALFALGFAVYKIYQKQQTTQKINVDLNAQIVQNAATITAIQAEIDQLNNEDLRKTNNDVKKQIADLQASFKSAVIAYEEVLYLEDRGSNVTAEQSKFSSILNYLAQNDYPSAQKAVAELTVEINTEKTRLLSLAAAPIPSNVPEIEVPPASGYRRQKVVVGDTSFMVDVVSADLSSTKVIVDTASDGTCTNNCPVLPLATFVSRSGAYAGVNGTYFCPDTYPSCVDKKNTFDVLVMNKNKVYFNSDNNVYSTVPVAIFSGTSARFIGQSSGWGRDTGVDAVIANRPLLVLDGNDVFTSGGEDKEVIRSNRGFLGATSSTAYLGVVHNASVVEMAQVLQAMGIKNAINLDSGGSTAMWSGGYIVGPGRDLPNVVLFVKR